MMKKKKKLGFEPRPRPLSATFVDNCNLNFPANFLLLKVCRQRRKTFLFLLCFLFFFFLFLYSKFSPTVSPSFLIRSR